VGAEEGRECRLVRVLEDGTPVLFFDGEEHEVAIDGVRVTDPRSAEYVALLERLRGRPLLCQPHGRTATGRLLIRVRYFAWQDKSGDVWLDLAETLVREGIAEPDQNAPQIRADG
jgi:hypothetical protein